MNWTSLGLAIFGLFLLISLFIHSIASGTVKRKRAEFALMGGKLQIKINPINSSKNLKEYITTDQKVFTSLHQAHHHQVIIEKSKNK